ncbi:uncharacterized protein [Lolium perenne]|uniref:uncharacterized protein n=1 Tax=Lolium perenne TaxID=4522 RepID=UPI003A992CA6
MWEGRAEASGGHCHVNWCTVSQPISLGGLGVRDMERAGLALRLRWLWYSRTDQDRTWSGFELQFTQQDHCLFFASTFMIAGDGRTDRLWKDRWIDGCSVSQIAPKLYACVSKRRQKATSIVDGLHAHCWAHDIHSVIGIRDLGQYLVLWRKVEQFALTDQPDHIIWRWNASGTYFTKSCYLSLFHGSRPCGA